MARGLDRYALAAGGILLGGFLLALTPCGVQPMRRHFDALGRARTLAIGLQNYTSEAKRLPGSEGLQVLVRERYVPEQVLTDPWGRPFVLRVYESGEAEVVSLGSDGVPGGRGDDADIAVPVTLSDR